MTSLRTTTARRSVRVGAAVALGAGLALAAPLAAQAHVGVSPDAADAGASTVLTFAFSHGCDGSPTTALRVDIPEGVVGVAPTALAGWAVQTESAANGSIASVSFTADAPVPDGIRGAVSMSARLEESLADSSVAFPVTQVCAQGETAWTEIAEDGADPHDLEAPAPVLAVGAVATDDHHGAGTDSAHGTDADHDADAASADTAADGVTLPMWLAIALPVLSLVGIGVAISALAVARRAHRS